MTMNHLYFRHRAGSRNDLKMLFLVRKKGVAAKALYWDIIELLFSEGGELPLDIAKDVSHANRLRDDSIARYVIFESGFFENDGVNFWCPCVLDELNLLDYWSGIYSKSAICEWSPEEKESLRSLPYLRFLKTRYWKDVSDAVKERDGNKCAYCGSTSSLEVHHITYNHHGDEFENLDDLVCLCHNCHSKEHGL